jgi:hypothetical protein
MNKIGWLWFIGCGCVIVELCSSTMEGKRALGGVKCGGGGIEAPKEALVG